MSIESLEDRCLLSGGIAEFPIPTSGSQDHYITAGPDGNLWFTEIVENANKYGRITPTGTITEFSVPFPGRPYGIVTGPDSNIWFDQYTDEKIVRSTVDGEVNLRIPLLTSGATPGPIVVGPDNNLWFVEDLVGKIGRVNLNHNPIDISEFAPNPYLGCRIAAIAVGPNRDDLWFTEYVNCNAVGRITLSGEITEYPLTGPTTATFITAAPDGNLWFTSQNTDEIGRITPNGVILPAIQVSGTPYDITVGPDGYVWFTERVANKIGRILPFEPYTITEFPILSDNGNPWKMTVGPDGNIWFVEPIGNRIGKLYVLTASGLTLGEAVRAGQQLDAVVATFHDDEPGMLGRRYQVDINWGDSGQAWTMGGGNWAVTGSHTYDTPGRYDIMVTIADHNAATGMTATVTSAVKVTAPNSPPGGNGGLGGAPSVDVLAAESLFGRERKPEGIYPPSDGRVAPGPRAESRVVIAPLPVQASVSVSLLDSPAVRPSHRPTPADLLEPLERLSPGVAEVLAENWLS